MLAKRPLRKKKKRCSRIERPAWYNPENFNELRLAIQAAARENWDDKLEKIENLEREAQAGIQRQQHRQHEIRREIWQSENRYRMERKRRSLGAKRR